MSFSVAMLVWGVQGALRRSLQSKRTRREGTARKMKVASDIRAASSWSRKGTDIQSSAQRTRQQVVSKHLASQRMGDTEKLEEQRQALE